MLKLANREIYPIVSFYLLEGFQMREKVQAALGKVRATLRQDGGDVVLVDVSAEGVVTVRLTGACKGCPMSDATVKNGIERFLKSEVPGVTAVVAV